MGTRSFVSLPTLNVGYAASVLAASAADLASIPTLGPLTEGGYASGQQAFVTSNGGVYVLKAAVGTADGVYVIATADDLTRQWVFASPLAGNVPAVIATYSTQKIDMTVPQTVELVPALGAGLYVWSVATRFAFISQTGTCTSGPTIKGGNNVTQDNFVQSLANFPSATNLNSASNVPPGMNLTVSASTGGMHDLTVPVDVVVVSGATGTGGYTLQAKIVTLCQIIPASLFS